MLLEIAVEIDKIQVVDDQEDIPPSHTLFGTLYCVCCGSLLYGHGWRKRYFIDTDAESMRLWMHRKLCSGCGMTYTLLPKWVHALKLFSISCIRQVLKHTLVSGHLSGKELVSKSLQRKWRTQFIQRESTRTNQLHAEWLHTQLLREPGSCLTSPLRIHELTVRITGKMEAMQYKPPGAHHRLLLFIPEGLQ